MSSHQELRRALGSYVLGALEPAERSRIDEHLAGCPSCRDEVAFLAGVPGLLSRLSIDEAREDTLLPPPTLLPRLLTAVDNQRVRDRRRLRRWQAAASGCALAAVAAGVLVVLPAVSSANSAAARPLAAAPAVSATGVASLDARPWGTSVHLRLHDLPPAQAYTAWAVSSSGTRSPVANWGPSPHGDADVTGATALPPDDLHVLTVTTVDGRPLLTLQT